MIYYADSFSRVIKGSARDLSEIPDESVHMVCTSPPYWSQRKYEGAQELVWEDGTKSALGLEKSPELYIAHLVQIFREVKRVLRPDGTLWLNIGDSYAGSGCGSKDYREAGASISKNNAKYQGQKTAGLKHPFIKPLDRVGIPEMLILALRADGWHWRSTVIWEKENCMPESIKGYRWEQHRIKVKLSNTKGGRRSLDKEKPLSGIESENPNKAQWVDCPGCPKCAPDGLVLHKGNWRPTDNFDFIYQLSKGIPAYGDGEDVKTPNSDVSIERAKYSWHLNSNHPHAKEGDTEQMGDRFVNPAGANLRAVWRFPSAASYKSRAVDIQHYAAFPEELPQRCILISTPPKVCAKCGAPYARVIKQNRPDDYDPSVVDETYAREARKASGGSGTSRPLAKIFKDSLGSSTETLGWLPTCSHNAGTAMAVVLDCFMGTGSTLATAKKLGRFGIGCDLSEKYCKLSTIRVKNTGFQANLAGFPDEK